MARSQLSPEELALLGEAPKLSDEEKALLGEAPQLSQEEAALLEGASSPSPQLSTEEQALLGEAPSKGPQVSKGESFLRGAAQGASFGFADEIAGAVESAFTDKTYTQARDESRAAYKAAQQSNPFTYLSANVLGGVGTAVLPGLNMARLFGAGVKGAALAGAAEGVASGVGYSEAEDAAGMAKDAAVAGAFGAGAGAALAGIGAAISRLKASPATKAIIGEELGDAAASGQKIGPERVREMLDSLGDHSAQIEERALNMMKQFTPDELKMPEKPPQAFINTVVGNRPGTKPSKATWEHFQGWMARSDEYKDQAWKSYLMGKARLEAVKEVRSELAESYAQLKDPFETSVSSWFYKNLASASHVADKIDNVAGTNITGLIYKATDADRMVARDAFPLIKEAKDLIKRTYRNFKGGAMEDLHRYLNASADDADEMFARLTPEQQTIAGEWRDAFEKGRQLLNEKGLKVQTLEGQNYVYNTRMNPTEVQAKLTSKFRELKRQGATFHSESEDEGVQAFLSALENLSGGKTFRSERQIANFLDTLSDKKALKEAIKFDPASAFKRDNGIPELLLEKDIPKLFTKYLTQNLKALHYGDFFQELRNNISVVKSLKMRETAQFLEKYARSMAGEPSNFMAAQQASMTRLKTAAQEIIDSAGDSQLKQFAGKTLFNLSDFASWGTAQIYPNYLGWRIDAPLRNLSQTWLLTAPEIGWKKGMALTGKAHLTALRNVAKGESIEKFLKARALDSDIIIGQEQLEAIRDGLNSIPGDALGKGFQSAFDLVDKLGRVGMHFYGYTDKINRYITWHVGQELGEQIAAGQTKGIQPFLKRVPAGIKAQLRVAIQDGDSETVKNLVSKYLVESTQFQYSRADLSQFGRDFGKFATMFTKWPTMVIGDAARLVSYEKGLRKVSAPMIKYFAPVAVLAQGNALLKEMEVTEDPAYKILLGKRLTDWAPAMSFNVSTPPLVGIPLSGIKGLLKASELEADSILQGLGSMGQAIEPFLPGGYARIATNRVLKALGEE